MSDAINAIFENFRRTISGEVNRERARAEAAERSYQAVIDGLSLLVAELPRPANDLDPSEIAAPQTPNTRRSRNSLPDEAFLSCLTTNWITALEIRCLLLGAGHKVGEGTIYNRMRKLAAERENEIEAEIKPERWRLRDRSTHVQLEQKASTITSQRLTSAKMRSGSSPTAISAPLLTARLDEPMLHHGDCLEVMKEIPDGSVDLIVAALPYKITRKGIKIPIPLDRLWAEYRRIIKQPTGNIVLFGSQPFTSKLVTSAEDIFRHPLVWEKNIGTGFQDVTSKPMVRHEDILVFSPGKNTHVNSPKHRATYNPQGIIGVADQGPSDSNVVSINSAQGGLPFSTEYAGFSMRPDDILRFPQEQMASGAEREAVGKPVTLLEHLIRTYSNADEVVLDNTMGSGSTGIAALNTGRKFIGIEKDQHWFEVAKARIEKHLSNNEFLARPASLPAPFAIIEPSTQQGGATLYLGDNLELMRAMPAASVDLIFTSPPYNLGMTSKGRRQSFGSSSNWRNNNLAGGYASYDDARPWDNYYEWQRTLLSELWRLLSATGAIFYNHKPRSQEKVVTPPLVYNPGLPVRQNIIWHRKGGNNANRSHFLPSHEWITVFAKPDFKLIEGGCGATDVWTVNPERKNNHPAPFPVELPRRAIAATDAQVIFDPFLGHGATGVAAMQCGRKFIGIELDSGYIDNAAKRMEAEKLQIDKSLGKRAG